MAILLVLCLTALVVAVVEVPERRRRVSAARWWRALDTLRGTVPTPARRPPPEPPRPELGHVRVLRPRGRPARRRAS